MKKCAAALFVLLFINALQAAEKKPNVVFIFSDDQRADTIRALGNEHIVTPNLDRLVNEGTTFTRAYCMGAMQGAVCVPSRAMMLSGRTLFRIDQNLKDQVTWPQVFAKAGYATFGTGKWHNGAASVPQSFANAKAIFVGGMGDPNTLSIQDVGPNGEMVNKRTVEKHSTEFFTDTAIDFIKTQKGDAPFALYLAFNTPHDPRNPPKKYRDMYDASKLPLPKNYLPQHPFNCGELTGRDEQLMPWPRTPERVREELAEYYGAITYMDEQVGRLINVLRENGLYENTIIVFASDHGLAIGSHGLLGKQNLYEHSMRTPLIIAGPGIPKGKRSDAFCYLLDLFPTLCELSGVDTPPSVEGKSLAPVLSGKATAVRETLFTGYRHFARTVRDDRWKLIVYPHINKIQLFDLKNDPDEMADLSKDAAHAGEIERLTNLLKKWQGELDDKQPLSSEKPQPEVFDFQKFQAEKEQKKPK